MKNIVLIGLQSTANLGDRLVYRCTASMLSRICEELGLEELRQISCDMLGKAYYQYIKELPQSEQERKIRLQVEKELKAKYPSPEEIKEQKRRERFPNHYAKLDARPETVARINAEREAAAQQEREEEERHELELKEKRRSVILSSAREAAENCITEDTAAVLFVGGGIIKSGHPLGLGYLIQIYVEQAQKFGIPVMFSAVGVEGFTPDDPECGALIHALNLPCVKAVTVRDDPEFFIRHYRENPAVSVQKVPCPTCMTKTYFPMGTLSQPKTIGIGTGKPEWFLQRNPGLTEKDLLDVWAAIIAEVERRGYDWQIFSNGLPADQAFGRKLLKRVGKSEDSGAKLLPNPRSIHQLLDSFNLFEGIIGSRLHTVIPAYTYGIPTVELVWNDKQLFFARDAGISDRFFEVPQADAVKVVDKLEEAMKNGYPQNEIDPQKTVSALRDFMREYVKK